MGINGWQRIWVVATGALLLGAIADGAWSWKGEASVYRRWVPVYADNETRLGNANGSTPRGPLVYGAPLDRDRIGKLQRDVAR